MTQDTKMPPDGFELLNNSGPFAEINGPFYCRARAEGGFDYGFYSEHRHLNPTGVVHGGMLYSFADHIVGHAIVLGLGRGCATVSLSGEFMGPVPAGKWVAGEVEILRQTLTMAFVRINLRVDDEVVFYSTGVIKLFKALRSMDNGQS